MICRDLLAVVARAFVGDSLRLLNDGVDCGEQRVVFVLVHDI